MSTDRRQEVALARLRIKRRGIPPPLDEEALRRALGRIAKKERKERRRRRREVSLETLLTEPSVPDPTVSIAGLDAYRLALELVTVEQATVVDSMVRLGMTRREVARALHLTVGAVNQLRKRALAALKTTVLP